MGGNFMKSASDLKKLHEWDLAIKHREALKKEDFETCEKIQAEIDFRIENDTINHDLMNGFRSYDHKLERFVGEPNFEPYNGLFKNYKYKQS